MDRAIDNMSKQKSMIACWNLELMFTQFHEKPIISWFHASFFGAVRICGGYLVAVECDKRLGGGVVFGIRRDGGSNGIW